MRIVLSPHLDDAVLSCWHALTDGQDAIVVTVFAGVPEAGGATAWDRALGWADSAALVRQRLHEDALVMNHVGCAAIRFPFVEAQYRSHEPDNGKLIARLQQVFQGCDELLIPLGLGGHDDHVLARNLALRCWERDVTFYADQPYASSQGWFQGMRGAASSGDLQPSSSLALRELQDAGGGYQHLTGVIHELGPAVGVKKQRALQLYASQYELLNGPMKRLEDSRLNTLEITWTAR